MKKSRSSTPFIILRWAWSPIWPTL
uniref:Uncharacterized protein n=1 Tax=Anguilla anguilla TaxID=7936 RepID=A0A0E9TVC1_ANGAN